MIGLDDRYKFATLEKFIITLKIEQEGIEKSNVGILMKVVSFHCSKDIKMISGI